MWFLHLILIIYNISVYKIFRHKAIHYEKYNNIAKTC